MSERKPELLAAPGKRDALASLWRADHPDSSLQSTVVKVLAATEPGLVVVRLQDPKDREPQVSILLPVEEAAEVLAQLMVCLAHLSSAELVAEAIRRMAGMEPDEAHSVSVLAGQVHYV